VSSGLGSIYIDGIVSGIDTSAIIEQIAAIRQRPVQILETRKTEQSERLTIYQSLNVMLTGLAISAGTMADTDDVISYAASSSDTDALAVTVSGEAGPGSYDIVIKGLASAHKLSSTTFADDDDAIELAGDIILNGTTVTIESSDSLNDIAARIKLAGAGVWATVIDYAEDDHRLVLTGQQTGADNAVDIIDANSGDLLEDLGLLNSTTSIKHAITKGAQSDGFTSSTGEVGELLGLSGALSGTVQINGTEVAINLAEDTLQEIASRISTQVANVSASVQSTEEDGQYTYYVEIVGDSGTPTFTDDNNVLNTLGVLTKQIANELQSAGDAEVTVDQVTVYRATNSVSDLIQGVTLDLLQADDSHTITVTVTQDTTATYTSVSQLVSSYNSIIDNLREGQTFDTDTNTGGVYFGDPAVRLLESGLHSAAMTPVDALGGSITLPSQIGLSTDQYGRLVLDQATFVAALEANPLGVTRMFGTAGEATHADITYVSSTASTVVSDADGYAVEITQIAERATATSGTLASGITTNETLTFNDVCPVQLTSGMSLAEAADALNSGFQLFDFSLSASVVGDTIVIEHELYGDSYSFEVHSNLAQGAGGLNIGGATAGEDAGYVGVDVAGTINGEDADGNGRYLTGSPGNATTDGLVLRVETAATGSKGVVKVSQGLAARLQGYIQRATDEDNGSMTIATDNIESDIESLDEEIERVDASVERYLERLRSDLLAMESVLAQTEALSTFMTNQLKGLTTNYYNRD